jgi:HEAT repeat protein
MTIIIGITAVLFAWAVALMTMALVLRAMRARDQRRRLAVEHAWRDPVDDLILHGRPLPPVSSSEQPVVLELLLRYRALLRGPEASHITNYLEQQGYVDQAVGGLRSRNRWRRASSAMLLGRMRSDAAVAALVDLMGDEDDDVRMVAARSLAAIGDPAAVEALTVALADPSRWTATTVASDLVEMGPAAVPTLVEIASATASGRAGAQEAAVTAVRVLGEIRDPRAEPVLIRLLQEATDLDLRARAAVALGELGGPLAPQALRTALRDPAWQVRAQAASSIGALGDRGSVAALSAAIADREWWVRRNCAEALGALGDAGREALAALSGSSDPYVRDRCVAVLQELSLAEAGPEDDSGESGSGDPGRSSK